MTTTTLLKAARVIACLFVLVALFSCDDHRLVVGTERFRLKRSDVLLFKGYQKTVYNYVVGNRLANYEVTYIPDSPNPPPTTPDYTVVFSYNAQNRLIKAETAGRSQVVYEYDGNGRMKSATLYNNAAGVLTLAATYVFEYGAGVYPTKVTYTSLNNPATSSVSTLMYTNENVASVTQSINGSAPTTTLYTYENKLNPYFGLVTDQVNYASYNLSEGDFLTYSKNLRVSPYISSRRTYDTKGLLIIESFLFTGNTSGSRYEYETY
jgi:YD repeat-containing protein